MYFNCFLIRFSLLFNVFHCFFMTFHCFFHSCFHYFSVIPWPLELAEAYLSDEGREGAAKQAAVELQACYGCLSANAYDSDAMANHCRRFCILYKSLHDTNDELKCWKMKPKLHMFQELCEFSNSRPSCCWTYRDEDFGGSQARAALSRGGANRPRSAAWRMLSQFIADNDLPRL